MRKSTLSWALIALVALSALYACQAQAQAIVGHVGDKVTLAHINFCNSKESAVALAEQFRSGGQNAARAYFAQHDECDDDYVGFEVTGVIGTYEGDFNGAKRTMTIAEIKRDDGTTVWMITFVKIIPNDSPA